MKNRLLTLVLLLSILGGLKAQDTKKIDLGFYVGPRISWLKSNHKNIESQGAVLGYLFGLQGDYYFTDNYSFTTGVVINRGGGKLQYSDNTMEFNRGGDLVSLKDGEVVDFKLNYVEIPLSLKLRTNEFGRWMYYGQFGFNPAILTSAEDADDIDISEEVSSFNLQYHIGLGAEYFLSGTTSVNLAIVYGNGLLDLTPDTQGRNDLTKLYTFDIKLGLIF